MKNGTKYIILAVVFVVLLFAAVKGYGYLKENYEPETTTSQSSENGGQSESDADRQAAPDFTVYDAEGNSVQLSGMQGNMTIVNFWATWCYPCRYEMPDFQSAYEKYGEDVNFMMINLTDGSRDTVEGVKDFIALNDYTFPVYYDTEMDAANTYGAYSIPRTFIIDPEGYIVFSATGPVNEATLTSYIEEYALP